MSVLVALVTRTRRAALALGMVALLAFLVGGSASQAAPTTFTVNTTDDADDGTCDVTHSSLLLAL